LAANERHDNRVHLIVDRGPAHRAKKTKAFVETLGGKLRLFFLPTYSPDRNPDELGWKHLKADKVGRMAVSGKGGLQPQGSFVDATTAQRPQ
jgi:transposase